MGVFLKTTCHKEWLRAIGASIEVDLDTGVVGTRLGYTLGQFISGVGVPDYVVFDSSVLEKGDGGVHAAGWFDHNWKLDDSGFLRGRDDSEGASDD